MTFVRFAAMIAVSKTVMFGLMSGKPQVTAVSA